MLKDNYEVVEDVGQAFALIFAATFHARAESPFRVALSGGSTARGCYRALADHDIDWREVEVFWGDERCVDPSSEESNQRLAREALLDNVGPLAGVHPMSCGPGVDDYDALLRAVGPLDLVHLGVGGDGHTASLFPGSPGLDAPPGCLVVENFDATGRNHLPRVSITLEAISQARVAVFTVTGDEKREVIQQLANGADLPANRVEAQRVIWLFDRAAAAGLAR